MSYKERLKTLFEGLKNPEAREDFVGIAGCISEEEAERLFGKFIQAQATACEIEEIDQQIAILESQLKSQENRLH